MYRFMEYALFCVVVILLQVFLFGNLNLSIYIHPLVYIAIVILLPMEMPAIAVLALGLFTGVTMDFFSGEGGINTIATLATAFSRPLMLSLFVGKEGAKEGGSPIPAKIGRGKFFRYCSVMVLLQCIIYFSFEAMTWSYFHLTLLRTVLSAVLTVILVFLTQMLFMWNHSKYTDK